MITGLWGRKIGMTQVFVENAVVPVTVIGTGNWLITQVKTQANDGYDAVQVGQVKDKFVGAAFSKEWLKKPKHYFKVMREVRLDTAAESKVGEAIEAHRELNSGDLVDVFGITKGCGYAGVVRRHRFAGPPASHGSTMGKKTGSLSFFRSQGRVIKGKRMSGHMGVDKRVMANLKVVRIEPEAQIVLVKGCVPGKSGSLVFVRKA